MKINQLIWLQRLSIYLKWGVFYIIILALSLQGIQAQNFSGIGTLPSNGPYTLKSQPGNFIHGTHRWQIILPGIDFTYQSSIFRSGTNPVNSPYLFKAERLFNFESRSSQLFADAILPAVTYQTKNNQVFGFLVNIRAHSYTEANQSNIDVFLQEVIKTREVPNSFSINGGYAQAMVNTWLETQFNYGRLLYDKGKHRISAGAAVKLLSGAASGYMEFSELELNGGNEILDTLQGQLRFGYNAELDEVIQTERPKFGLFNNSSIGFDLGVTYYLYDQTEGVVKDNYRLSLSLNAIDLGSIRYSASPNSAAYTLRGSDVEYDFLVGTKTVDDFIDSIDKQFNVTKQQEGDYKMSLPTRFSLALDYRFNDYFSLSVIPSVRPSTNSFFKEGTTFTNTMITPRYSWRRLVFYLPFNVSENLKNKYGLAIQYGSFAIGSSNFWNRTIGSDSNRFNLFLSISARFAKMNK